MPDITRKIVVIGAGLTGLATAFYLKKAGIDFVVLEKDNRIGGVIHTNYDNGFVYESGPNTGVVANPEIAELFEDLSDKCTLETANPDAKFRWIWKKGKWHALPSGLLYAIRTPLFTANDKFRILGEPFRKRGNDPNESVAELVVRRLGKSYLDYAVDPFISGIYAGDPNKLVTRYALPKLYNLEQTYGSFIKGAIKKKSLPVTERDKKASREVFSAKGGLQNLINALETSIGKDNILLNSANIKVNTQNNGFKTTFDRDGEYYNIHSSHVVSSVGAYALGNLLPFLTEEELMPIQRLEYAKIIQVTLAFEKWQGIPLHAFGGLIPSIEKRKILGVLFTSSFFDNRAPDGGAILSVFMGGMKSPEVMSKGDDEIKSIVFHELGEMLGLKEIKPDVLRIFRYPAAIPQYDNSSGARLAAISELQKKYNGLILGGNIRDGIGMADRVKQAVDISNKIKNNDTREN